MFLLKFSLPAAEECIKRSWPANSLFAAKFARLPQFTTGALMRQQPLAFGIEPSKYRYRLRLARYVSLAESVAAAARGKPRIDLLDLGVGHGRSLRYLEPHGILDRIRFTGVDLSPRRLSEVYGGARWRLLQHNIEQGLPFDDESFDVIICEQVLEHLHAPESAVAEMNRVLRPGGTLVIGVPIFPAGIDVLRRRLADRYHAWRGRVSDHPQTFTLRSIRRLVQSAGAFDVRETRGFRIISGGMFGFLENSPWWWKFNRLLGKMAPWACTEVQLVARKPAIIAAKVSMAPSMATS